MHQQPTQTGQWPIPGPPQHEHHYYSPMPQSSSVPSHVRPYPPDPHAHLDNQFAHADHPVYGAPYPVHPPQHWGGYPPASQGVGVPLAPAQLSYPSAPPSMQLFYNQHRTQGLGQQAPAPPSYPAASPLAQTYHHHTQQGLGQQPVVAAEESAVKRGKRKAVDLDDAPPSKRQAIQPLVDGNQHYAQGLGQQAPALPSHPTAFPLVQTYHQHTQQGLWQQPPVVAAESAVKRGKRKAVDLDDAPPPKRQAIQPRVDDFNIIPINGSTSRGYSSNIGGSSSKTQEEAVAQVSCEGWTSNTPSEFFPGSFEYYDWTSSGPLEEPVKSLDQSELAWNEQVKEFFDIIYNAAEVAPGELEVVNSAPVDSASGEQSQESINSPNETGDLASDDLMNSFVKADDPDLVGKLLRKLIDQWFP